MRQDWIEFEGQHSTKNLVPIYQIAGIVKIDSFPMKLNSTDHRTEIKLCGGDYIRTIEPYEQVKQKIMDGEKVDLSDVVVEHFNREEYMNSRNAVETELSECPKNTRNYDVLMEIQNKLNEILKERE